MIMNIYFQNENKKLKPIIIQHNTSAKSLISIKSFDNEIFENVFDEFSESNLNNLKDMSSDLVDLTNVNFLEK